MTIFNNTKTISEPTRGVLAEKIWQYYPAEVSTTSAKESDAPALARGVLDVLEAVGMSEYLPKLHLENPTGIGEGVLMVSEFPGHKVRVHGMVRREGIVTSLEISLPAHRKSEIRTFKVLLLQNPTYGFTESAAIYINTNASPIQKEQYERFTTITFNKVRGEFRNNTVNLKQEGKELPAILNPLRRMVSDTAPAILGDITRALTAE